MPAIRCLLRWLVEVLASFWSFVTLIGIWSAWLTMNSAKGPLVVRDAAYSWLHSDRGLDIPNPPRCGGKAIILRISSRRSSLPVMLAIRWYRMAFSKGARRCSRFGDVWRRNEVALISPCMNATRPRALSVYHPYTPQHRGITNTYICHKWRHSGFPWIYQAFTRFVFICTAIWSNEKYSRTLLYNTKPSPSLRRNSRKKKRSGNKMAAPKASVHPVRNCLCYHFFLYQTNKSCSRIVSRRLMLLRSLNKSYLQVTAPNATEAERPFYERSRIVLHVIRRLDS